MSTLKSNTITTLASSDSLLFSTNATERLRISLNGNIGIGTGSPSTLLDVDGTVKSTGLYCTGNVGIGTTIPTAANVALQVNGTVKNTNPAFSVTYSASSIPDATLSRADIIFDADTGGYLDVGDCFNTTTGTFTAPVEGYYFFSASILFTVNGTSPSAYGFWYFAKNGIQNHVNVHSPNTSGANYINYYTLSGTSIQHLNAGDYMNIRYYGSPYSNGYAQWSGFLIG